MISSLDYVGKCAEYPLIVVDREKKIFVGGKWQLLFLSLFVCVSQSRMQSIHEQEAADMMRGCANDGAAAQGANSIESQQTFQQTFQQSF